MRMPITRTLRRGLMLSFLILCLASCASKPVRTEAVEVGVPVYVALPVGLVEPCLVATPSTWTNGTLGEYAIDIKACLAASNDKLIRIKRLQP